MVIRGRRWGFSLLPGRPGFLVVVGLFLSAFIGTCYETSYAYSTAEERALQTALEAAQAELRRSDGARGVNSGDAFGRLRAAAEGIKGADHALREKFKAGRRSAEAVGPLALRRHDAMEAAYIRAMDGYLKALEGLGRGGGNVLQPEGLKLILHKNKKALHGLLPYRNLNYPTKEPDTSVGLKPAYLGGDDTVLPEYTLGTEEAPVSLAIANLAQSLNWKPAAIYAYVKNNIETEWYWGCMKGAEETLRQGSGNDCAQASLLTALLRASGFPTRYVIGSVRFFATNEDHIGKAKHLLGIEDPWEIAAFFQKAGIPFKPVITGGTIGNFEIEHIWVESYIPYGNYRGAIIDDSYKMWLGLDTSLKVKGYKYNSPVDIMQQPGKSGLLDGMPETYLGAAQTQTLLEYLESSIAGGGYQLTDFLMSRSIVPERLKTLPGSTQFTLAKATHEYTAIPDELKHKVRLVATAGETVLFDITMDAMKLANRKVSISGEPEAVEDQEIIDGYGGLDNTPAYLVKLRPVLKVDGEVATAGSEGLFMGSDYTLTMELVSPGGTETAKSDLIIGNLTGIGIVTQRATPYGSSQGAPAITEEDDAETIIHKELMRYIDRWNRAEEELANLLQLRYTRPIPTVALMGGVIDVSYVLDLPHGYDWKGEYIDASVRAVETAVAYSGAPLAAERKKAFMRLSGLQGSVLEERVFEDDFGVDSISTAKVLELAGSQSASGIQILSIDGSNGETVIPSLPFDDAIKGDITDAVNQGFKVKVPSQEMTYKDWTGVGYLKENPNTGEAGYMLSGMIAGGMTAEQWVNEYLADLLGKSDMYMFNKDPLSAAQIVMIPATDGQIGTVGTTLAQRLAVLVLDSNGYRVNKANVTFTVVAGGGSVENTVRTGVDGIARSSLFLGQFTGANPGYRKANPGDEFDTQMGVNLVTASVSNAQGNIQISHPFTAYGIPGKAVEIVKIAGDGKKGTVNNPGWTLEAKLLDQYKNPISNSNLTFKALPAVSQDQLPTNYRNVEFYKQEECPIPNPLYGECATFQELSVKTQWFGATVGTMLGNTVNTKYTIEVSTKGDKPVTVTFEASTQGYRNGNDYIPPGLFIRSLQPVNEKGQWVNAAKVGSTLSVPLKTELFMLYDDYTLACRLVDDKIGAKKRCTMNVSGLVKAKAIPDGRVSYTAISGSPKDGELG